MYEDLIKEQDSPEIEIVYGPRQVGKTVLMKQMIQFLLDEARVPAHNIMYISMDHTSISTLSEEPIKDVMDIFIKYVLPPGSDKACIFLDEVQVVNNWSNYLKQYYDLGTKVKFYVCGSSVSEIEKGSSQSLIGRSRLRRMLQWSFADHLQYHLKEENDLYLPDPSVVRDALTGNDPLLLYEVFLKYLDDLLRVVPDMDPYLTGYIIAGGYPGLLGVNMDDAKDILMDRFMLTLHKDIMRTFAVRNIKGLENTVIRCAMQSCQVTDYHSFAKAVGIKYDTLMVYLGYLSDVFMTSESHFYSKSDSTFAKGKKLYLRDHGTRNVLVGLLNTRLFEFGKEAGKTVGTIAQDHASRLAGTYKGRPKSYYWKGKKEVDIIIEPSIIPIPVEVKYRQDPGDISGVREFMKEFGSPFGIVVTKDTLKIADNVLFIPLALFLLVC
ncbi:ATP-binding protein [Methanolobus psychrotolerans]|uniref:ATP-binding protein n=1 Tax=Methanolobus psychrotolerans TaxID=1874706 RepID=UPI000B91CA2B|nr:AAA family ATPase [Methanolobus psychrotolerans]